ncbi:metallopeptidase [Candidatus Gottesmanbacteria bacterium]|nr:metallopeptidase [Candidatus Gottesmanbacteria bacterium]
MNWQKAPDIDSEVKNLCQKLDFSYIDPKRIICFRSFGSSSRARARIWSFPKVWQLALKLPPHYVIEVLSLHFDHLSTDDKKRVLIHELMHIPKNFSGSLLPHRGRGRRIDSRNVEQLFKKLFNLL